MSRVPKVSILVPICNVEKYLPECLESLISQTLKDIEIICINDGSTDHSLDIIKEYAAKDKRIVIIDKPNSGYGDSMNKGIQKATGEYIGIVESDDWIEPNAFEELYEIAKNNKAEVVRGNYFEYIGGKSYKLKVINPTKADQVLDLREPENREIMLEAPAIWSAIYKRQFLLDNGIEFLPTPGASYQDTGFNFKVWASARRVYLTNKAYLHYRMDNPNSSVKSLAKAYNVNKEYAEIERFLAEKNLMDSFSGIMEVAKFGAYYWNAMRLPYKLTKKFIKKMAKEFKEADASDLIDWSMFDKKQTLVLKMVMTMPSDTFFLATRARAGSRKVKTILSRIRNKMRPGFRRQQQILESISQLVEKNEDLNNQIDELNKQINQLKGSAKK